MRSLLNNVSRRPYVAIIAISAALVAVLCVSVASQVNAKPAGISGQRLISLHEAGETRGILTDASTLRAAFEQANITIDPNDLVEPSLDSQLVASQYDVNIYRARPVTIVDGSVRKKIISPYQTATQIASHAKVVLHDEDTTTMSANTNITREGVGLRVVVERATPFTLIMYGKSIQAYTQSTTVGDMLAKKDIKLGEADTLSVANETPITAGMTVELWRNGTQTITEEQEIAFPVQQIKDADREVGYKEITTPGENGKRTVSYEVDMKNGIENSRKEIQSVTTKEPKQQVEVVGSKSRIAPYTGGGNLTEWLKAAGIPESDWKYVQYIAQRESGLNPNATNPSSGACGLIQAYPCSKVPGNPYNPVDNLKWANGYAHTCVSYRMYCGWEGAYNYWTQNGHW